MIVYDQTEDEALLILHSGVGFCQKIDANLKIPKEAKVFRIQPLFERRKQGHLLNKLDFIFIEGASDILTHAQENYLEISDYKILALADHIAFTIQRV